MNKEYHTLYYYQKLGFDISLTGRYGAGMTFYYNGKLFLDTSSKDVYTYNKNYNRFYSESEVCKICEEYLSKISKDRNNKLNKI